MQDVRQLVLDRERVMRDIDRIPDILNTLGFVWMRNPDMRLAQIVSSAALIGGWKAHDPFYCEDDKVMAGLVHMVHGDVSAPSERGPFLVIRRPSVQEDEGRYGLACTFWKRVEADNWIARQAGEYYGPNSYFVVEAE